MATKRKMASSRSEGTLGGFTIIEVVLVLAIAGLIFLMVFIAYPALRRSQRDTQRRDDMARLSTSLNNYQTNNNGRLPKASDCDPANTTYGALTASTTEACKFIANYMNSANATADSESEFVDPAGDAYKLHIAQFTDTNAKTLNNTDYGKHIVYLWTSAKCDGESVVKTTNSRDFAIHYKLEGGGTYCKDSGQ